MDEVINKMHEPLGDTTNYPHRCTIPVNADYPTGGSFMWTPSPTDITNSVKCPYCRAVTPTEKAAE